MVGVRRVLRLERGAWSMVKWRRQATNEYVFPPPPSVAYVYLRDRKVHA